MPGADPPAGWYPDPATPSVPDAEVRRVRWWDGQTWTAETQEAPARTVTREVLAPGAASGDAAGGAEAPARRRGRPWPRERAVAAAALAGLVLLSLTIWLVAVVVGGDPAPLAIDEGDDAAADGTTGDGGGGSEDGSESEDGSNEEGDGSGGERDPNPDAGADPGTDEGAGEPTMETVEFDDGCVVEVDAAEVDLTDLRPWHFSECTHAPIDPGGGAGRWIVVVASLNGDEVPEGEAIDRSERSDHSLLWSSHYPSLNPNLWVLFEGPFTDEESATAAADEIGGGSYPRVLSEDEGDRYCIAADGCVGGTGG